MRRSFILLQNKVSIALKYSTEYKLTNWFRNLLGFTQFDSSKSKKGNTKRRSWSVPYRTCQVSNDELAMVLDICGSVELSKKLSLDDEASPNSNRSICL